MTVRVLVVDDSGFFRRRIKDMLTHDPELEVVGEAGNGREAILQVTKLRPDVVTMDIEMPEMDGISAVREIMRRQPVPILMFSSLTYEGAQATLDALEAGATDFMPKRFADISGDTEVVKRQLQERVKGLGKGGQRRKSAPPAAPARDPDTAAARPAEPAPSAAPATRAGRFHLVVIGTSTGGPVALQTVMTQLPANYPLPVILVQHMPASFTSAFAERLNSMCKIQVKEAAEGDLLKPGLALLAPGGRQLGIQSRAGNLICRIFDADETQFYKPSVDVTFSDAAKSIPGKVLGVVLTGMGADGCNGARLLKSTGSGIWAQDEATSVIYGMPAAVAKAGLADRVLPLDEFGPELARLR